MMNDTQLPTLSGMVTTAGHRPHLRHAHGQPAHPGGTPLPPAGCMRRGYAGMGRRLPGLRTSARGPRWGAASRW